MNNKVWNLSLDHGPDMTISTKEIVENSKYVFIVSVIYIYINIYSSIGNGPYSITTKVRLRVHCKHMPIVI